VGVRAGRGGARGFDVVDSIAFHVEYVTSARHEEQRKPARVAREWFVIAGD